MTTDLLRCFFESLAGASSKQAFAEMKAGVAVMELYDSVKDSDFLPEVHGSALARIGRDIRKIREDSTVKLSLLTVLDVLPFWCLYPGPAVGRSATYAALLQYGYALAADAEWHLAKEIYARVAIDSELDHDLNTSAQARFAAGRAYRMCADWDHSAASYSRAVELGTETGDYFIAFRAEVGQANNKRARGDLPGTERQLSSVVRRAKQQCPEAVPHAIIAQAALANAAGNHERAIDLARRTLELAGDDDELHAQALVDIANFLADYGLPAVAKEALHIVAATAPEQSLRTHALLNLFFLATNTTDLAQFKTLRCRLESLSLTPRQRTQFALFSAQGLRNVGKFKEAYVALAHARQLAEEHNFFQLSFDADTEATRLNTAEAAGRDPKTLSSSPVYRRPTLSLAVRRAVAAVHSVSISATVSCSPLTAV